MGSAGQMDGLLLELMPEVVKSVFDRSPESIKKIVSLIRNLAITRKISTD